MLVVRERGLRTNPKTKVDAIAWWIDSGATTHVCKDRCWFKTYEPVEDEYVLYMGDDQFSPVNGKGSVVLKFSSGKSVTLLNVLYVPKLCKNLISGPDLVTIIMHARLGHVHYKRMLEMSTRDLIPAIDENPKKCTTCSNKRNKTTPYELWYKKWPNLSFLRVRGCRVVVRLPDPKKKTFGEKGIDCIIVGYAEYSKAYRFYVIEPNDSISISSIIELRDAIFDENRFSSIPRPKDVMLNSDESQRDDHSNDVPSETPKPRRDAAFWKEAIDDEIGSIIENNTWILSDLPPGCKPLGCKWIFKRKMKVDGTIDKFKARLVIQGFRKKEGIDYFDTYAPVAHITTIRLLLALAAIHNLVIHQMDVKTTFLNGDLEEVYMKQPERFVMPGNEHKVCKLVKLLYGLKQAPKRWHQKFDEVVLSSGFLLNQSDKCVFSKFNDSDKGVIICLYVDDMRIFGTDQNQVDKTKKFLSSMFSMKDMREADVILGIKIKRENKGIVITQSHYIEKILKNFNHEDCSSVSTPIDPVEKLMLNIGKPMDQLEYLRAIGCLMYAMMSTRLDIAYVVGRLSRFTSNPSRQRWKEITRMGVPAWGRCNFMGFQEAIMHHWFVALAAGGKEGEWLRNLIHKIPIWPKPKAPISIHCDSAATLAKAYSQIYNGKSRHLGVGHSMIRELITNGMISIEFVRSQHNLADHLMKGLARDLVIKCDTKRTTYVNMKFCLFKKLGIGFPYVH
ncbi:zinc finger, CCHC-type containing protein [Tanacetum coccineum]